MLLGGARSDVLFAGAQGTADYSFGGQKRMCSRFGGANAIQNFNRAEG